MDTIDIKIIKSDKGEEVIVLPQLSLGKITEKRGVDEHGRKYITMNIDTDFVMSAMENAVFRNLDTAELDNKEIAKLKEEVRGYMQEYAKSFILNTLGVKHTPIMRDENNNLTGFKEGYEINIKTE